MYVDGHGGKHITVKYVPAHNGHKPGPDELKVLPLPGSTNNEVAVKLNQEHLQVCMESLIARVHDCNVGLCMYIILVAPIPLQNMFLMTRHSRRSGDLR